MAEHETAAHSRAVIDRMAEIIRKADFDALGEVIHPDFVQEIPQSGERVVGLANFRKIFDVMPGEMPPQIASDPEIIGSSEHYVMTPTFQVVKVEDDGDQLTSYVKSRYPDGSEWYIVSFTSFKDGKIIKRVDFYAPMFEAPEWRAGLVEAM